MATKKIRGRKKQTPVLDTGKPPTFENSATASPHRKAAIAISLALVVITIWIYAPVRHHDFVSWDDHEYFSENPMVTGGFGPSGVRWAFTTGHMGNWNPLTWLSYMLGAQLFGVAAGPQLAINVFFHVLNSLLLFQLLRKMTRAVWRSAVVAALFAVHPLHVESVAWVSERKDVLSTFFGFLTIWAYLWYTRRPGFLRYLTVAAAFVAALMAKPMVVTLPLLMLLLDYWPLERLRLDERGALVQRIVEKLPLLAAAVVVGVVTLLAQKGSGAITELTKLSVGFRISNAVVAYVAYIGKMLWPLRLSPLYPLHPLAPLAVAGSALILILISAAAVRWGRRYPVIAVGWLWYLIALLPVIGIVQVGSQAMADRYTYVPLTGLFLIITWCAADLTANWPSRSSAIAVAAGIMILGCSVATRAQVGYWENSLALWTRAVQVDAASDTSQRLLANALAKEGRYQEALPHYKEALRIEPGNAEAHAGLGYTYAGENKPDDAIREYLEALRLKPDLYDAHNDLGMALAGRGRLDEAVAQYNEALRLKPYAPDTHTNLAASLIRLGRNREAEDHLNEALRLRPANSGAHNNLGILFANEGRLDEAVAHFQQALELKPESEDARRNLAIALDQRARTASKTH